MCGIYLTNIPFGEKEIKTKLDKIKYRGPDFTGFLKQGSISFGHLRLSILDLDSRSNQPYIYKHLTIVFNGEIYNFKDIKLELQEMGYVFETTSDTEVLIKGYDAWGGDVLNKLNGMFAFAIYDNVKQEVFCARDRMGVKPFYYYWNDGEFEICSQLQPLMNLNSKISASALSMYLSCGYVPSPFSILDGVLKLQPGYSLLIDLKNKKSSIEKYWDLEKIEPLNVSYEEAKERLEVLLKDAINIRLQADVPLGTFLSGGIDSALVTAIASEISDQKIKTFTIGFEDPKFDESKVAEQFSTILKTDHTSTICKIEDFLELIPKMIEVFDEPFADSSALPSLLLNKVTKQHVSVALSGDGGDESFIGYYHFDTINKFKKLERIPFSIRKVASYLLPKSSKLKRILLYNNENEFIKRIFLGDQKLLSEKTTQWVDLYYPGYKSLASNSIQKAADLNIKLWLENDSNVKVDRASMAYSMEVRSPFLDYRIIEFARQLPMKYRFNEGKTKIILKDILSKYIPSEIFNQPKSGFSIPIGDWMKNNLKDDFFKNVTPEFLATIPNLDLDITLVMINDFFYSKDNNTINTFYIWRLYVLNKWIKNFNENNK